MLDIIIHIRGRTHATCCTHKFAVKQKFSFILLSFTLPVSLRSLLPFLSPFITFTLLYSRPSSLSAYSAAPVYYSAAAVSQALLLLLLLLLAPAVATGPICSRGLPLPLFVIHCVVTLIIMDSARVFRLSAGSWSPHITLSLTCTRTRAAVYSTRSCGATKIPSSRSVARVHLHTWVQKHTNATHN